jgi:serine/threonine protein phosphatase PrpC
MGRSDVASALEPVTRSTSVARTSLGMVRATNEDRFLTKDEVGLWVVADGMGGHHRGDLASSLIVQSLSDLPIFASGYALLTAVRQALERVNANLIDDAAAIGGGAVIGSTVVALLISENHFACVWAGDSRAYRLRRGSLELITHDHSVVQEMIDRGELTSLQARTDRRANIITRALGVSEALQLDVTHGAVEDGDLFLLCSDGLTGPVVDSELAALMSYCILDHSADALLERALEHGANDNVTLVLVKAATCQRR